MRASLLMVPRRARSFEIGDAASSVPDSEDMMGNELHNLPQVVNGCLGPDYLVSHRLRLSLTSSWGTTLPALISTKPLSMPAKKRTRSSISSQVAESGSSWIVLMAMSLLVMTLVYFGGAI